MIKRNENAFKIVVIEDDYFLLNIIVRMLKSNNYSVMHSQNGEKGIKLIKKKNPDLIISDIVLKGEFDGYRILDEVRKDIRFLLTPFIFITGKTERSEFRKSMELGANDYIVKPFTEGELLKAIQIQLAKIEAIRNKFVNVQLTNQLISETLVNEIPGREKRFTEKDHILVTIEKEPRFLKLNKLVCITSLGDYSSVFTSDNCSFIIRKTMKWWESILPEKSFFRIHRSTIVNLDFIVRIERWFNNAYRVYLKSIGKPFTISRRSGSKLKEKFS
jgi:DNA-binding LytR/AlgR family response regulator